MELGPFSPPSHNFELDTTKDIILSTTRNSLKTNGITDKIILSVHFTDHLPTYTILSVIQLVYTDEILWSVYTNVITERIFRI